MRLCDGACNQDDRKATHGRSRVDRFDAELKIRAGVDIRVRPGTSMRRTFDSRQEKVVGLTAREQRTSKSSGGRQTAPRRCSLRTRASIGSVISCINNRRQTMVRTGLYHECDFAVSSIN